jgi:hypothetical protein
MHASTRSCHRRIAPGSIIVAIALVWLPAPRLCAGDCQACRPQPRSQDQVWLVSNRGLGCDVEAQAAQLRYWRYDREKGWLRASLAELNAADDKSAITTVFVHGNRIDWCEAFTRGWTAYRTLVRCADERPVRFVIWSWPSEAVHGPINDAREKACRTNPSGFYLAWFLDQLDPEAPLSLWAHSLGARVVTGALHLLGGGELDGHRLAERQRANRSSVQAVLVVAALDNDWLLPGHFHGHAMSQVSNMLLVNNCCDALLKRYHLIYGRRCPQEALGCTGLGTWGVTGADWNKVCQTNACSIAGRRHVLASYLASPDLVARMRSYLLFETDGDDRSAALEVVARTDGPAESP